MITINRYTDVKELPALLPHLILPGGNPETFLIELSGMMQTHPEAIFLLIAKNESDEVCGFAIAQNPGPTVHYVYLPQVWVNTGVSTKVVESMLARVLMWAASQYKTAVRGITARSPDAIYHKYGFEVIGYQVERPIESNLFLQLVSTTKEVLHGN